MIYFYLHKSIVNNQWYFNIRSRGNNQIVATSEGYHNKQDALNTINLIRRNAAMAGVYDASIEKWAA